MASRQFLSRFRPSCLVRQEKAAQEQSAFAVGLLTSIVCAAGVTLVSGPWQAWHSLLLLALAAAVTGLAAGLYVPAWIARKDRKRMISRYGTAFLVKEPAAEWTADDTPEKFIADIERRFAETIEVSGPVGLSRAWNWSLDEASQWGAKAEMLAGCFRTLYKVTQPAGTQGVFIWADWSVAVSLGAKVSSSDRQLNLHVWQRPSNARGGMVIPDLDTMQPHDFCGEGADPATLADYGVTTTVPASTIVRLSLTGHVAEAGDQVSILVLRTNRGKWGPLTPITDNAAAASSVTPESVPLHSARAGKAAPKRPVEAELHELRCLPAVGQQIPWEAFPSLVATCGEWIASKNAELGGHTLLLGATVPQEAGLGLGIYAGDSRRQEQWPRNLWPVVYQRSTDRLIVPDLDLGTATFGKGQ